MSQLGLVGPAPSQQNARGAMPGGLDPMASMFKGLEKNLNDAGNTLQMEGTPKCLRMANELKAMAVKVNRMQLEHQQEVAQPQTQASPNAAPTTFPQINAMGVAS